MGLVYLFALLVSVGLFAVQAVMGGDHGDAGGDHDLAGGHGAADAHAHTHQEIGGGSAHGALTALLSTRFWTFFALGFGLSGALIHHLDLAGTLATLVLALGSGLAVGVAVILTFRAVQRTSVSSTTGVSEAIGRTGRVLVSVNRAKVGQVRVELKGQSVDILATTDEEELARGEAILVESVEGQMVRVSRLPHELK